MVGLLVGTFATGATTAEGRLNVPLGGQSTTRRRYSRGTPSTLRAYPARGIFSSASCTARCCSGRGSRGSRPRFDPRVVICVAPAPAEAGDRPAWVELALGPGRPARVRVGARRRELHDPMPFVAAWPSRRRARVSPCYQTGMHWPTFLGSVAAQRLMHPGAWKGRSANFGIRTRRYSSVRA
jgi:hypothetical protein